MQCEQRTRRLLKERTGERSRTDGVCCGKRERIWRKRVLDGALSIVHSSRALDRSGLSPKGMSPSSAVQTNRSEASVRAVGSRLHEGRRGAHGHERMHSNARDRGTAREAPTRCRRPVASWTKGRSESKWPRLPTSSSGMEMPVEGRMIGTRSQLARSLRVRCSRLRARCRVAWLWLMARCASEIAVGCEVVSARRSDLVK